MLAFALGAKADTRIAILTRNRYLFETASHQKIERGRHPLPSTSLLQLRMSLKIIFLNPRLPAIRICLALAMSSIVVGCDENKHDETAETSAIMDVIENEVSIPSSGRTLDEYVRYYSFTANGEVSVVYITPINVSESVICDDEEVISICTPEGRRISFAEAGTRMWLNDFDLIPGMDDGGCNYIQFEFDPATSNILNFRCNALNGAAQKAN